MQFDLITSDEGMNALRGDWETLIADSESASPFMTWEWQFYWWQFYGDGHALRIIVARDGGRVVGILPLYIRFQRVLRGIVPLRLLQPVGTGGDTTPDYLDPLMAATHCEVLPVKFAEFLLEHLGDWDELRISDLRANQPLLATLERACRARGWPTRLVSSALISYLALPPTWEDFLQSVSRERRYKIRSLRKKFEQMNGARFFLWNDGARLDWAIDRLMELHQLRWANRGKSHAFSSDEYRNFHRKLMHEFFRRGYLRLYCLEIDSQVVMMFYCYRMGGVLYHFQTGFDPHWAKLRPGHLMMAYIIEQAIADGDGEFDLLRGQYDFKADYARETRETRSIVAARTTRARLVDSARTMRRKVVELVTRKP